MLADITGKVAALSDQQFNIGARLIQGTTDYALMVMLAVQGPLGPKVLEGNASGQLLIQPSSRVLYQQRLTTIAQNTFVALDSEDALNYHRLAGSAITDVDGGSIYIQESDTDFADGTNAKKWDEFEYTFSAVTVHAPDGTTATVYVCSFDHELTKQYFRAVLKNGANAQTYYEFSSWLMNIVL